MDTTEVTEVNQEQMFPQNITQKKNRKANRHEDIHRSNNFHFRGASEKKN